VVKLLMENIFDTISGPGLGLGGFEQEKFHERYLVANKSTKPT